MKVRIKRKAQDLPLPQYETGGSVGFDFQAATDVIIQPKEVALVPTGTVIETPAGYMLIVAARSSTPRKHGLSIPHGLGIIDQDYAGEDDEVFIQVFNFRDEPVTIDRGTRIAQGVFVRVDTAEWQEVERMGNENRGGFGSTW